MSMRSIRRMKDVPKAQKAKVLQGIFRSNFL